jgi:DNA-binding response OmpR family regulator
MLEELKEQYRLSLPEKVKTIRSLLNEFRAGNAEAEANLRLLAHSLHGSGTTFGYPRISRAAKQVEHASPNAILHELAYLVRVLLEASRESASSTSHIHILIIEDDADISNLMKVLLSQKSERYRATVAGNAAEATVALKQQSYALIVLDLVLPDADGRVLLREIRATYSANVPVFVLSGIERQSIKDECLALGAQRYFNKPFKPEAIVNQIDAELTVPGAPAEPSIASTGQSAKNATDSSPAGKVAGGRILVAEDDELLAGIIKHRLARDRFEVVHVTSGAEAMQAVEQGGWSLIILDVKMPVHDGFEVLARVRSLPANKGVPVIMLTAMGSEKDVVRGYDMGATDYIVKPFSPPELLARVKSLIKA